MREARHANEIRLSQNKALIHRLQGEFDRLVGAAMGEGGPVILLDFPNHSNVGDSAIWAGEVAWLDRTGRPIEYVCALRDFDLERVLGTDRSVPVLLHGGGNFGDIWPHHQNFREMILEKVRDRKVIQLPQSIHFRNLGNADRVARLIHAHPDFTLFVRDHHSLEFARERFNCEVQLCPDAAFNLGIREGARPQLDILALLRTDEEVSDRKSSKVPAGIEVEDWLDEPRFARQVRIALAMSRAAAGGKDARRLARFNASAEARVDRGLRQLARGRVIVTDRLHGHILSMLLGKPQALLDNEYGKIARFMDAFTGGDPLLFRASSAAEAFSWAREVGRTGKAA